MIEFKMPALGADMEAGRLVKWLVKPGDEVKKGDVVAVVDTDKAAIEVEVWDSGVVDRLIVEPGKRVPVGTVLAVLRKPGEAPSESKPAVQPPRAMERVKISPAARKRASELGIELTAVTPHGPHGVITLEDVESAQPSAGAAPEVATMAERAFLMRKTIAGAMERANREIPHYYLSSWLDLQRPLAWLEQENAKRSVVDRILPVALLLKAISRAAKEVPEVNGFWKNGGHLPAQSVHLGVAISLRQGGLIAPAIHDADRITLDELMRKLKDLVERARSGQLRSSELSDPTLTVTNLGELGVETVFGVIYPPQVAIVGLGTITPHPWPREARDGSGASGMEMRPSVNITLSADHRVSDGYRGAAFLRSVSRVLKEPETL